MFAEESAANNIMNIGIFFCLANDKDLRVLAR